MSHICKRTFEFKLQLRSYWQNIKFSRYCPKFPIFTNFVIFQVYLQLLRQLLHPYKFYGRDMSGILFFIFASCHPLKKELHPKQKLCMFCELSQNYQHSFQKLNDYLEANCLRNSKMATVHGLLIKTCKILCWSITQEPLGLLKF